MYQRSFISWLIPLADHQLHHNLGDHTFGISIDENPPTKPKAFFNSGGGRDGDNQRQILNVSGSVNDLVRMALGRKEPLLPIKEEYGKDDVEGKETCGIIMSGVRQRSGTCQQCCNRLLYVISPDKKHPLTLSTGFAVPRGYWLTVKFFGIWGWSYERGNTFKEWCDKSGFEAPPVEREILESSLSFLETKKREFVISELLIKEQRALNEVPKVADIELFYDKLKCNLDTNDLLKMGI